MARPTASKSRALKHIIPSALFLRRMLQPLEVALRMAITAEKDKSWFPKLPMLAHLLCGVLYQVAQHRSLRELLAVVILKVGEHLLQGFSVARSTLSDANNSRRRLNVIRQVFANLISQTDLLPPAHRRFARLAALDSTLLHCVPSAKWAKYRKNVNACKAHVLLDLAARIPKKLILSVGRTHDRKVFSQFLKAGWTYIVDRAYNDYKLFDWMHETSVFFITRLKSNASCQVLRAERIKRKQRKKGVLSDLVVRLGSGSTLMKSPLRIVTYRTEDNKIYRFLTNRFDLSPLTIANLYHARWAIEKFFKWLKRTLSMERTLGRSELGMEIHVLITLITDALLKMIAGLPRNYQHIPVRILRIVREYLFRPLSAIIIEHIRQAQILDTG